MLGEPIADLTVVIRNNVVGLDRVARIPGGYQDPSSLNFVPYPDRALDVSSWDGFFCTLVTQPATSAFPVEIDFTWFTGPTASPAAVGGLVTDLPNNICGTARVVKQLAGRTTYYVKNRGPFLSLVAFTSVVPHAEALSRIILTPTNQAFPWVGPYTPTQDITLISLFGALPAGGVLDTPVGSDYVGPAVLTFANFGATMRVESSGPTAPSFVALISFQGGSGQSLTQALWIPGNTNGPAQIRVVGNAGNVFNLNLTSTG